MMSVVGIGARNPKVKEKCKGKDSESPGPATPHPKCSPSKAKLETLCTLLCRTHSPGPRPFCFHLSYPSPLFLCSAVPRAPSRVLCCPLTPTALSEDPASISDSGCACSAMSLTTWGL